MVFTACGRISGCTQVDANGGVLQYELLLEQILVLTPVSDWGTQISSVSVCKANVISCFQRTGRKTASFFNHGCHEMFTFF